MSDIRNLFTTETQLYIAGIRTPFSNISITSAFNSLPSCAVTIPPDPSLYGIGREDRVPLQIFTTDPMTGDEILIFDGEISSFSYSSTRLRNSITIEAQSVLSFMRDVQYQVLNSLDDFTIAGTPSQINVAITGAGTADFVWPLSLFLKGLTVSGSATIISSPTEYLDNVVAILNDPEVTAFTRSKVGEYYLSHSHNLNLSERYTKVPYFDDIAGIDRSSLSWSEGTFPILSAVQRAVQVRALTEATKLNGAKQGSFYDMLNQVTRHMEYEVAIIAAPHYHTKTGELVNMVIKPILYEANPPMCNIMYRPMVEAIQTQETTYGVPTRIRVNDVMSPLGSLAHNKNDILTLFGTLRYFPSEIYSSTGAGGKIKPEAPGSGNKLNVFASEVLRSEAYTGPYQAEGVAPIWMSYAENAEAKENDSGAQLQEHVLAHLLFLARNSIRSLNVTTMFNPYVTPGFPGVVFDSEGTGFNFIGFVTAVQHNISKSGVSTSVSMSYVRTLEQEVTGTRLSNSYPAISDEVTHDNDKMTVIYNRILGCDAIEYETLQNLWNTSEAPMQQDPLSALAMCRRTIATKAEYTSFMQVEHQIVIPTDTFAELITVVDVADANLGYSAEKDEFYGRYVQIRRDPYLRGILRTVAEDSKDNTIYYR